MEYMLLFLIWMAATLFLPELLGKLRIPWITAVILAGIMLGPYGLELVEPSETVDFLASLGLVSLVFLAGLEVKLSDIKREWRGVTYFTSLNFLLPLVIGSIVGLILRLSSLGALTLGICFSSSFVGVIVPTMMELKVNPKVLSTVTTATFIQDVLSLLLVAVVLKAVEPSEGMSLPSFLLMLVGFITVVFWAAPRVYRLISRRFSKEGDVFEKDLRAVIFIVALMAFISELIGIHEIVGAFLVGLALAEMLEERGELKSKLFSLSYGFLIPIFLLSLGFTINIRLLLSPKNALVTLAIVGSLILSKTVGGFIGARLQGFKVKTSLGMGVATMPQLSATLAVASVAHSYGLFGEEIMASILILAIVTVLAGPLLTKVLLSPKSASEP